MDAPDRKFEVLSADIGTIGEILTLSAQHVADNSEMILADVAAGKVREVVDHVVTEDDIAKNPHAGWVLGATITVPAPVATDEEKLDLPQEAVEPDPTGPFGNLQEFTVGQQVTFHQEVGEYAGVHTILKIEPTEVGHVLLTDKSGETWVHAHWFAPIVAEKTAGTYAAGQPTAPAAPVEKPLMFQGKKVVKDVSRMVNDKEYHHVSLETGESLDLTDAEYDAIVAAKNA